MDMIYQHDHPMLLLQGICTYDELVQPKLKKLAVDSDTAGVFDG